MNNSEITEHKLLKEKFKDYPKLPKFILNNDLPISLEHAKSCVRGFYKRLGNWQKMKYKQQEAQEREILLRGGKL